MDLVEAFAILQNRVAAGSCEHHVHNVDKGCDSNPEHHAHKVDKGCDSNPEHHAHDVDGPNDSNHEVEPELQTDAAPNDTRTSPNELAAQLAELSLHCDQTAKDMDVVEDVLLDHDHLDKHGDPSKKVLLLQAKRTELSKIFDSVLKRLIARREVHQGYQALVQKIAPAYQKLNDGLRKIAGRTCEGEDKPTKGAPPGARGPIKTEQELQTLVERLLALEKKQFETRAAWHMEQIKVYQNSLGLGCGGVGGEGAGGERVRALAYAEVVRLKRELGRGEELVEEVLGEIRYLTA